MKWVIALASGVVVLLLMASLLVLSRWSTGTTLLWESCQPASVDYGAGRHFCVRMQDREYAWGWSRERELAIVEGTQGRVIGPYGYFLKDSLITASVSGLQANWGPEGVEFRNAEGLRLFVPKKLLTSGR